MSLTTALQLGGALPVLGVLLGLVALALVGLKRSDAVSLGTGGVTCPDCAHTAGPSAEQCPACGHALDSR